MSSIVHVPGRADKYMTTATACNKGIGLILRVMFPLTRAEHIKLKDWGFVTVPTFNSLNFIGKSKDPETFDSKPGDERLHECASQVNPLVFLLFSISPPLPSQHSFTSTLFVLRLVLEGRIPHHSGCQQ